MRFEDLPRLDLAAEDFQHNVDRADAAIAEMRRDPGVAHSDRGLEVLSYDLTLELFRDQRFALAMDSKYESLGIPEGPVRDVMSNVINAREGEAHTRMRRACASWFSARGAERLREGVRRFVGEVVERCLDDGEMDFHLEIARALPPRVFCTIVGAPFEEADIYADLSEGVLKISAPPHPSFAAIVEDAVTETRDRVLAMIEERSAEPGEDLISHMLESEAAGAIVRDDIVDVVINVLIGSTDTTDAQMCLNLVALEEHRDQWARLKREPDLVPNAVLELLRFNPGVWTVIRSPLEELEFNGFDLTPEDTLWLDVFAANRDPRAFDEPRKLDVGRKFSRNPQNFGSGIHGCLGRMITLLEQQEALRAVLEHWSSFEVLDIEMSGAMYTQAVRRMPVAFVPDRKRRKAGISA